MPERLATARVFHALGNPTRRDIIERLSVRARSVTSLASALGLSAATITEHLHILENARLVRSEKVGRVRTCRLSLDGITRGERWLSRLRLSAPS
ncbi:MAG: winged helix-turn-helix transcriptional regulator [Myxococcales bacterium]|nr:winged helix-turn-helix transcriptional regulator [Myxococcales bacterium]